MSDETIKELKSTWEDMKDKLDEKDEEIEEHGEALGETEQEIERLNDKLDELETKFERPDLGGPEETEENETKEVFFKALKNGKENLEPDEKKGLTVSDDTTGGYLAPSEYVREIIKGVTEYSPLRDVARVMQTSNRAVEVPTRDGTFSAQWVSEDESRSETTGLKWGMEEVPTHELEALVKISQQNLEDSVFDLEAELSQEFTEQFGVAEGKAFITGDAVGKPEGLTNSDAKTVQPGNSTSGDLDDADDLIDTFYSLKSPYTDNATWIFNRKTLKKIRKLKDTGSGSNQYVWQPGLAGGQPATIMGQPYLQCKDMEDPGSSGNLAVGIGDFGRGYLIVDKLQMSVMRDPYSSKPFVEFEARKRVGGQVVLPEAIYLMKIAS